MIIIIIIIIIIINNDYNDSNRNGKALKLATKETLKIKNTSCLIFETLLP